MMKKTVLTYKGLILEHLALTMPSYQTVSIWDGPNIRQSPEPIILSFSICTLTRHIIHAVYSEFEGNCPIDFATLGDGLVCPYCQQYNPSGRLSCWACGGPVERMPFIKPVQLPTMYSTVIQHNNIVSLDEPTIVDVELTCYDGLDPETHILPLLNSGTLDRFHNGFSLTGAWLCPFCGSAVEGDSCPLCGGHQLPYNELVKIDRDCLYCGQRVENGLVCRSCGGKLSGLTYKAVGMAQKPNNSEFDRDF